MPNIETIEEAKYGCAAHDPSKRPSRRFDYSRCEHKQLAQLATNSIYKRLRSGSIDRYRLYEGSLHRSTGIAAVTSTTTRIHKLRMEPTQGYLFVKASLQRAASPYYPSPHRVLRQRAKLEESLDEKFRRLAETWRRETKHLSLASEKANNFAYHQIMAMGEKVLPFIFRELQATTSDWFWALRAIARDSAPVIPEEDKGRVRRVADIWMDWGKRHGYVSR